MPRVAIARPVYTAPDAASSTTVTALVPFTLGDQPEMVPASPAKMKMLVAAHAVLRDLEVRLRVEDDAGRPGRAGDAGGIATTSDCGTPVPSYSVEVDVPVIGDPDERSRIEGDTPAVDQMRVGVRAA